MTCVHCGQCAPTPPGDDAAAWALWTSLGFCQVEGHFLCGRCAHGYTVGVGLIQVSGERWHLAPLVHLALLRLRRSRRVVWS